MFSRPVPSLQPTEVIKERQDKPPMQSKQAALEKLIKAAQELIEKEPGFALATLAEQSGVSLPTVRKHWETLTTQMGLNWIDLPCLQTMTQEGKRSRTVRIAMTPKLVESIRLHVRNGRFLHAKFPTYVLGNRS